MFPVVNNHEAPAYEFPDVPGYLRERVPTFDRALDQYFDEAQWESYRKLGEHIGEKLFGDPQNLAFIRKIVPQNVQFRADK